MLEFTAPAIVASLALLLVRLVLSVTFFIEARIKFRDIKEFSKADNLPLPVAYFVAIAEAAAALGMLTGVLAQWAGIGLVLLMMITIVLHVFKWRSPYAARKGGWEYDLLLLALAAVIACMGAGQFILLWQ